MALMLPISARGPLGATRGISQSFLNVTVKVTLIQQIVKKSLLFLIQAKKFK